MSLCTFSASLAIFSGAQGSGTDVDVAVETGAPCGDDTVVEAAVNVTMGVGSGWLPHAVRVRLIRSSMYTRERCGFIGVFFAKCTRDDILFLLILL